MLLNSGVGQGLFFAGLKHVAIQVIASFSEDKVVTTNPEELLAQGAVQADFETAEEGEVPAEAAPQTAAEVQAQVLEPEPEPVLTEEEKMEEANFQENVAVVLDQAIETPQNIAEGAPQAAPIEPKVQDIPVQEQVQPEVQVAPEAVELPQSVAQAPQFEAQGPITIDSPTPVPAPAPEPVRVAQVAATPNLQVEEQDIPVDFS